MAIRVMREMEVPQSPRDRVFRASRWHAVLLVATCLGGCAALIWYHRSHPTPAYFLSAFLLLILLALRRMIAARFHPSNWLVRVADDGLFIHYRSFLNERLGGEDPTVAFIGYQDIRSARRVREKVTVRNGDGRTETQYRRYVELELSADPAALAAALDAEDSRSGVPEKHWYGTSTTIYRDYPVQMQSPPFLRLHWQVVPGIPRFLDCLRPRVQIAAPVKESDDFTDMKGLTRAEQEQRLRDLDRRGQTMAAVALARKLYGLDLGGATRLVNGLRGGTKS